MATTVASLIKQVRRYVRDYPELDTLAASLTTATSTLSVNTSPASNLYVPNTIIQVESEAMLLKTVSTTSSTVTVTRAVMGTTAATHASALSVLVKPHFLDIEILDALNYAKDAMYPYVYKYYSMDTQLTATDSREYAIPSLTGTTTLLQHVNRVEYLFPGGDTNADWSTIRTWEILRSYNSAATSVTVPIIKLGFDPEASGKLRITGYAPFEDFTLTGSTESAFPPNAIKTLILGAVEYLLASGEAGRVRTDTGLVDQRENANRTGSSMQASNALLSRFERSLNRCAMPPMPMTVRSIWYR
jgi:hypothetical protein